MNFDQETPYEKAYSNNLLYKAIQVIILIICLIGLYLHLKSETAMYSYLIITFILIFIESPEESYIIFLGNDIRKKDTDEKSKEYPFQLRKSEYISSYASFLIRFVFTLGHIIHSIFFLPIFYALVMIIAMTVYLAYKMTAILLYSDEDVLGNPMPT